MQLWHAVLLGIVQGITEFLPISSDGHLVVVDALFHLPLEGSDALGFDILLHAGSLLAILLAYWVTWEKLIAAALQKNRDAWILIGLLVVATIPGVIAGLFFEDAVSGMRSLDAASTGFLITAAVLIIGEYVGRQKKASDIPMHSIGVVRALLIGCAQAIAILPGVSRSGSTISLGRALGLTRSNALDFSFLMAAPIIGGAVAKTLLDAFTGEIVFPSFGVSITGFIVSFIVSMIAIGFLRMFVVKKSLAVFAWYLIPLGLVLRIM